MYTDSCGDRILKDDASHSPVMAWHDDTSWHRALSWHDGMAWHDDMAWYDEMSWHSANSWHDGMSWQSAISRHDDMSWHNTISWHDDMACHDEMASKSCTKRAQQTRWFEVVVCTDLCVWPEYRKHSYSWGISSFPVSISVPKNAHIEKKWAK